MKRKGFGVEDTPFMILATILVMMFVVWIGMNVMAQFTEGNERQAAIEASAEIYKRAKLLSFGYDGSSDRLTVSVPDKYMISLDDGSVVTLHYLDAPENATALTEPMGIAGVAISGDTLLAGNHDLVLTYSRDDSTIFISEE